MSTPRITRAQAAEHFARRVAGQNPPPVQALLDGLWSGKPQEAEPVEEVVVPMASRVGLTEMARMLGPGVFEFTVPSNGVYSFTLEAPPFDGPQNRQGRRAHARKMRKLGLGLLEIRRVATEGGAQ